jgi:hypothetical protein
MLIKANLGSFWVIRGRIQLQKIFHAPHKLGSHRWNAPFLLYPKLKSFFFSSWRTVSCEMLLTIFNCTKRSANNSNVHRFRSAGGWLWAKLSNATTHSHPGAIRNRSFSLD